MVKTDIGAKGKGRRAERSKELIGIVLVLLLELVLDQIARKRCLGCEGLKNGN
jgi:hypothetical protein